MTNIFKKWKYTLVWEIDKGVPKLVIYWPVMEDEKNFKVDWKNKKTSIYWFISIWKWVDLSAMVEIMKNNIKDQIIIDSKWENKFDYDEKGFVKSLNSLTK